MGEGEAKKLDTPVFLARIDNVGYEATGGERPGSEVSAVARQFNDFVEKNGW